MYIFPIQADIAIINLLAKMINITFVTGHISIYKIIVTDMK